jgi:hypothetical protein
MSLKLSSLPPIESSLWTKAFGETLLERPPVSRGPMAAHRARSRSRKSTTRGGTGRIRGEAVVARMQRKAPRHRENLEWSAIFRGPLEQEAGGDQRF